MEMIIIVDYDDGDDCRLLTSKMIAFHPNFFLSNTVICNRIFYGIFAFYLVLNISETGGELK